MKSQAAVAVSCEVSGVVHNGRYMLLHSFIHYELTLTVSLAVEATVVAAGSCCPWLFVDYQ